MFVLWKEFKQQILNSVTPLLPCPAFLGLSQWIYHPETHWYGPNKPCPHQPQTNVLSAPEQATRPPLPYMKEIQTASPKFSDNLYHLVLKYLPPWDRLHWYGPNKPCKPCPPQPPKIVRSAQDASSPCTLAQGRLVSILLQVEFGNKFTSRWFDRQFL